MEEIRIGILGGSGLYAMDALKNIEEVYMDTPFGKTSDAIITGEINGVQVAFMARHGRSHSLLPSEVPYRANIFAMKTLGVRYLLSVSAVGSLKEEIKPRDVVIASQYIDYTKKREMTFFGNGMVAHVSMAKPTCPSLNEILSKITQELTTDAVPISANAKENPPCENPSCESQNHVNKSCQNPNLENNSFKSNFYENKSHENKSRGNNFRGNKINAHVEGTYICIEGPQFSSFAESNLFRLMGADIIGMTNMPEAKLAREAQIAYASLAMVTDYDCWNPKEQAVNVDMAIANLKANAKLAQDIIQEAIQRISTLKPVSIAHSALKQSLVSPLESLSGKQKELVELLLK